MTLMRRLLIIGCGDVGMRLIPLVRERYRLYALTRDAAHCAPLRALGVTPVMGDLDKPHTLEALAGIAQDIVHLAPPPAHGSADTRTAHLIAALGKNSRGSLPQHFIYISTSGVYGDCGGAIVAETRTLRPATPRARRRVDAEQRLRAWGGRNGVRVSILRVPGIYAADRLPTARLARGTPALRDEDDGYVNHVHADDLAQMVVAALHHGQAGRAYNATDDMPQKMGAYFDLVADRFGYARPRRVTREQATSEIPESLLSFMSESRRLSNRRIKEELRVKLRYPSVREGLLQASVREGVPLGAGVSAVTRP